MATSDDPQRRETVRTAFELLQPRRNIENQIRGALKTLGVVSGRSKGRGFMRDTYEAY
jgi:hypothetical protein